MNAKKLPQAGCWPSPRTCSPTRPGENLRQERTAPARVGVRVLAGVPASTETPDEEAERGEEREPSVGGAAVVVPEEYRLPLTMRYMAGAGPRDDRDATGTDERLATGAIASWLEDAAQVEPEFGGIGSVLRRQTSSTKTEAETDLRAEVLTTASSLMSWADESALSGRQESFAASTPAKASAS